MNTEAFFICNTKLHALTLSRDRLFHILRKQIKKLR